MAFEQIAESSFAFDDRNAAKSFSDLTASPVDILIASRYALSDL
jgi:hypothetical protein